MSTVLDFLECHDFLVSQRLYSFLPKFFNVCTVSNSQANAGKFDKCVINILDREQVTKQAATLGQREFNSCRNEVAQIFSSNAARRLLTRKIQHCCSQQTQ